MDKISIELAINDHTNFQICMWKTGLNLLTYRKITDLSDVRTVSFWWKIYFCPRFINQNTAQKLKVDFSSKANSSNFHYFLPPIGTVVYVPQCHDACMQELSTPFGILGHRERRPGAGLGPLAAGPMASAHRTPPLAGCQVHYSPA